MLEVHHQGAVGRLGDKRKNGVGWSWRKMPINLVWGQGRGEGTYR